MPTKCIKKAHHVQRNSIHVTAFLVSTLHQPGKQKGRAEKDGVMNLPVQTAGLSAVRFRLAGVLVPGSAFTRRKKAGLGIGYVEWKS